MKPLIDAKGLRLWGVVAATVRPLPGRAAPATLDAPAPSLRRASILTRAPISPPPLSRSPQPRPPQAIEPGRQRRLARGRDDVAEATIDLHGLDQDRARRSLTAFILEAQARGRRAILVITGKGALGDGVLRRRTPEWLAEPPLRGAVAGLSEAHRRHGGAGALYVALRRKSQG